MSARNPTYRQVQLDVNGHPIPPESYLLDEEGDSENVAPSGAELKLPWLRRSRLRRVIVNRLSGSAVKFNVTIRSRPVAQATLRDIVFQAVDVKWADGLDEDVDLPFEIKATPDPISGDVRDQLFLEIKPNVGADNDFEWRLIGTGMV